MVDWLIVLFVGWLVGCLVVWLVGWLFNWLVGWQVRACGTDNNGRMEDIVIYFLLQLH